VFSFFGNSKNPRATSYFWNQILSTKDRNLIDESFSPLGDIDAKSIFDSNDPFQIINTIDYLKKENLRDIAYKIIKYTDNLVDHEKISIKFHFYFQVRGEFFYRWRDIDAHALDEAIKSFENQISMAQVVADMFRADGGWQSVPAHAGYRQLRIIEEKRGNLQAARALCEQAKSQGWADDWDSQIKRIDKKLKGLA